MFDIVKNNLYNVNFDINLFLHFLILYTFLSIFFMKFISKVSSNAFNNEVSHLINDKLKDKLSNFKTNPNFNLLTKFLPIDNLKKLLSKQDSTVKAHNDGLFNMIMLSVGLLWTALIVIILILKYNCNSNLELQKIIIDNLIVFAFVGLGEYYFFTRVALKFIPVEPSFISKQLIKLSFKYIVIFY
jgi:hypothetical protein